MATLNLANSLVYAPSTHRKENLLEAVDLYEEILRSGVRNSNPAARARVLANQGNALAHLGYLDAAHARLIEARSIFEKTSTGRPSARSARYWMRSPGAGWPIPIRPGSTPRWRGRPRSTPDARCRHRRAHLWNGVRGPDRVPARVPAAPPRDAQRRAKVTVLPRDGSPA